MGTYMLAVARCAIVTLRAMDKCRLLLVEAVQAVGLFVDKSVILRHKLPTNLSRIWGLGGSLPRSRGRRSGDVIDGHNSVLVSAGWV